MIEYAVQVYTVCEYVSKCAVNMPCITGISVWCISAAVQEHTTPDRQILLETGYRAALP